MAVLRAIMRTDIFRWRRHGAKDQDMSFPIEDLDTNAGVEVGKGVYFEKRADLTLIDNKRETTA